MCTTGLDVTLPREVLTIIYEYNVDHRPLMSRVLKELQRTEAKKICMRYTQAYNDANSSQVWIWASMEDFLYSNCYDPEGMFELIKNCNCCKRHYENRPLTMHGGVWDYNKNGSKGSNTNNCNCDCTCRQYSRFLCRTFDPNHYNENGVESFN